MGETLTEETKILEQLYRQYASMVYRYALSSLCKREEAEDVVQEVFFRVCHRWHSFRGDSHVRTWILQIARNCIVDAARGNVKREKISCSDIMVDRVYDTLNTSLEIEDLFDCVPKAQQQILDLRIVKDLSVAETAKVLQCSKGKVRVDTHRALVKLRKVLAEATL